MQIPTLTRGRRVLLWAFGCMALLMLLAWLALPRWLRGVAQDEATAALGREVRIEALRFNPLTLTLAVDGLQIAGPAPDAPPLLRLPYAAVNVDIRSLFRLAPVVEAVDVDGLELRVTRLADGRYDIDDLIARFKPKQPTPPDERPARFALYNLSLRGGLVRFDDRPKAKVHELRALTLGLPCLSNLEEAVDVHVEPRLAFELGDTHFDTGAQAKPFTQDRAGVLTLKTGEIDLANWLAYLPAALPVRPAAGRLSLDFGVQFKAPASGLAELALKGSLQAKALQVVDATGAPLAEVAGLAIQVDDLQPLRRRADVRSVALDGLSVTAARDAQGRINWLRALAGDQPASPARAAASAPAGAAGPRPAPDAAWQLNLGRFTLQGGRVRWLDDAVRPAAQLAMEELTLQLDGLRWPVVATAPAAKLSLSGQLAAPAVAASSAAPSMQVQGEWSASGGQLQAQAARWPLGTAGPYLAAVLKPRLEGELALDATARWQGAPGEQLPTLQVASLQVDGMKASLPGERQAAAAWKQLRLAELSIDAARRQVALGRMELIQPQLRARRDADGQIDLLQWVISGDSGRQAADSAAPPWAFQVGEASVDSGRVAWQDLAAGVEPVALELQRLSLKARGLQWPADVKARVALQGSVQVGQPGGGAAPGSLAWQGDLGLAPLSWRGRLKADHVPVHAVAAYAGTTLPVTVGRADASWAGQMAAGWAPQGLTLDLKGDARVNDLRLFARRAAGVRDGDELLSWQSLELPGVLLAMAPGKRPRVELGEARLSDFYARLSIDETGQFNLSGLNAPAASASAPAAAAPAAPAAPTASAPAVPAEPAFDLAVAGLQLKNGRVDFSDRFIRPNYSAALSDLGGRLGAFRTGTREMATLDLQGRVAGTGQLEVRGAVNPTAQPLALDVQARASDLELAPLSPYAGKYAGYAIERGKLTMDVAYRIEADGRLDARNKIVLNQLTFGERIDSPEATKLPVLLAVALLKDSRGVIDLDLPVGGSINDPEFSIGGVVIKIIVNLLTKALTAPFALLAGGGGEDLSLVEFLPGTARLAEGSAAVIDKVARALTERPALQMTVTGAADPQSERGALQAAWLDGRLAAEWRKERLRAGTPADATPVVPASWSADERGRLVRRLYADTPLPNKPRNALGLARDIPPAEMEALLRGSHVVSTDNARELALQRGLVVRDALLAKGLPSERLFLAAPKLRASGEDDASWTPRVQLGLGTP